MRLAALRDITRIPHLTAFLSGHEDAVLGWGRKRSGIRARKIAKKKGLPFLLLEDGFLRSLEREDAPLSLVRDDLGVYYDAGAPSRLEHLIATPLTEAQAARAQALIMAWRNERVSKYNGAREFSGDLPPHYVLVCDQTLGDASIAFGGAGATDFHRMLDAALAENPDATIVVKTHPDVLTRARRGHFARDTLADPRILVVAGNVHPVRLIEQASRVYAVTSQMGFEALIWGKPVRCFGMPFYAGWGLTDDERAAPDRRGPASLLQLVHAALIAYPRYVDPETGEGCPIETVLAYIGLQRRLRTRLPAEIHALGFSRWKRPIVDRFLAGSDVRHVRTPAAVPSGATIAVWGARAVPDAPPDATIIRMEDGFLRSVGLGADLVNPLSWVCDGTGLYYDSRRPSALELILERTQFDAPLLDRARHLRETIIGSGLSKYNLDAPNWSRPDTAAYVILIPGQVETDASIRFGAPGIATNGELAAAVRAAHPDAYLVYKPHPDVVAGLREKGSGEDRAAGLCDEIVVKGDIAQMLAEVDAVHTLTSLAGFEALLRGKPVTCYGQPFYAGWGLTEDKIGVPRRTRRLTLDALVAGSLILYPRYVSRITQRFTTPERALAELLGWRRDGSARLPAWRRALRPLLACVKRRVEGD